MPTQGQVASPHVGRSLWELREAVEALSDDDLMVVGGVCHDLELTEGTAALRPVLDGVMKLVVAVWLERTGESADLDDVMKLITEEYAGTKGGLHG
ncbi:hypothetical protein ACWDR1_29440 [Streptosporangium sandarakinum]